MDSGCNNVGRSGNGKKRRKDGGKRNGEILGGTMGGKGREWRRERKGGDEHRRVGKGEGWVVVGLTQQTENNTAAIVPVLLFRLASFTPPPVNIGGLF